MRARIGQGRPGLVPTALALACALGLAGFGIVHGTWAAGGSDSSCYALMAQAFARGQLQPTSELAAVAPWPDADLTTAPGGFVPSRVRPHAASPVCAPGFALLLAPLVRLAGPDGLFLFTPLAGGVLVWCVFLIGRYLLGPWAGVFAAATTVCSPIVLFQVTQPMNDIPTTALWVSAVAVLMRRTRTGVAVGGTLAGVALLVRPNLLPIGVLVGVWVTVDAAQAAASDTLLTRTRCALAAAATFAGAVLPWGLLVLWFNAALYGSPFRSGYGDTAALFGMANVGPNLTLHSRALVATQTLFPLIGLLALLRPSVPPHYRSSVVLCLLVITGVALCYLPYRPYPEWWYLRFLLPAVVLLLTLASVVVVDRVAQLRGRTPAYVAPALALFGALALCATTLRHASDRQVFDLQRLEARFRATGEAVADRLPSSTVALALADSGSIRFYAGREAVLWDSLDPAWLDRGVAWLEEHGHAPVVVIERREEPMFRARFAGQTFGALDWPPRLDIDNAVRVFVAADRTRYLAGKPVVTETIWGPSSGRRPR